MKKRILLSLVAVIGFAQAGVAATVEDEIADRIRKVGSVCIEGQDCVPKSKGHGEATPSIESPPAVSSADIGAIYKRTCGICHDTGVADAPTLDDVEEWATRLGKGIDTLYESAIDGIPPAMPPMGTCFDCSQEEIKALVDYMLDAAQ